MHDSLLCLFLTLYNSFLADEALAAAALEAEEADLEACTEAEDADLAACPEAEYKEPEA